MIKCGGAGDLDRLVEYILPPAGRIMADWAGLCRGPWMLVLGTREGWREELGSPKFRATREEDMDTSSDNKTTIV